MSESRGGVAAQRRDRQLIRECYRLAAVAAGRGNHPFGALLLVDDDVVLRAENSVNSGRDITAHAELELIRKASAEVSATDLARSTLYSSTEPCAMCAGAVFWALVPKLVYGCSASGLAEIAGEGMKLGCRSVLASGVRHIEVVGPVLEDEGLAQHRGFWD